MRDISQTVLKGAERGPDRRLQGCRSVTSIPFKAALSSMQAQTLARGARPPAGPCAASGCNSGQMMP